MNKFSTTVHILFWWDGKTLIYWLPLIVFSDINLHLLFWFIHLLMSLYILLCLLQCSITCWLCFSFNSNKVMEHWGKKESFLFFQIIFLNVLFLPILTHPPYLWITAYAPHHLHYHIHVGSWDQQEYHRCCWSQHSWRWPYSYLETLGTYLFFV